MSSIPPDLPEDVEDQRPQNRSSRAKFWWWSFAIALSYGIASAFARSGGSIGNPYGVGLVVGGTLLPLIVAGIASRVLKSPRTPLFTTLIVVGIAGLGTGFGTGFRAGLEAGAYQRDFDSRAFEWSQTFRAWSSEETLDVERLLDRDALRRTLEELEDVDAAAVRLKEELETGEALRDRLTALEIKDDVVERAWQKLRERKDFDQWLSLFSGVRNFLGAARSYLTILDTEFGHWSVAPDQSLLFDQGVPNATVQAFNNAASDLRNRAADLEQLTDRIQGG